MGGFAQGDIWLLPNGRDVEILRVDRFATHDAAGSHELMEIIAFRFMGGTSVFMRTTDNTDGWVEQPRRSCG